MFVEPIVYDSWLKFLKDFFITVNFMFFRWVEEPDLIFLPVSVLGH